MHKQLADLIRADIHAGRLKPGAQIPSEARLVQIHGIGQMAVRQALRLLRGEGLIVTIKGKGSAVAGGPREPYPVEPGSRVVLRMPSPDERRKLGDVPEGVPVAEITPPGKGRHRKLVRGDRHELLFDVTDES
ncbi:GntR family transcriptional regulator [Nonomuraea dietziae]|uniref:GntR family transcriptional regulator n=1 Tax=Nonomuraea dietziae TaxID=65515 RepID=A0A7W5VIA6_9ACTN|nr:GntR family transcriptional regulator [Nonomuraea dietziae]MBB3734105.1 GntR family transcriptional regulator [Nonomuraea dietziae]